jgi:predicted GNAT superfamily acetyltransferase
MIIRPFRTLEEYQACVEFQEEVWGRGFSEKVPPAILKIANRIGGLAAGAFDEVGSLQGFVFGLTGIIEGRLVHWSDMLAVKKPARDRGLGTRLKEYQRGVMLGRGVLEMQWTFDPLQGRNAHVNFAKLGIVSSEYMENMYGDTASPLHRGIGTDRLVARWHLDSRRVAERLQGNRAAETEAEGSRLPSVVPVTVQGGIPYPGQPALGLDQDRILLPVPAAVDSLMGQALSLAARWREVTREAFGHYLSRGYRVQEFIRGCPVSSYLLVRVDTDNGRMEESEV